MRRTKLNVCGKRFSVEMIWFNCLRIFTLFAQANELNSRYRDGTKRTKELSSGCNGALATKLSFMDSAKSSIPIFVLQVVAFTTRQPLQRWINSTQGWAFNLILILRAQYGEAICGQQIPNSQWLQTQSSASLEFANLQGCQDWSNCLNILFELS